jgi:hypothetical protein
LDALLAIQEMISNESSSGRNKQRPKVARWIGEGGTPSPLGLPLALSGPTIADVISRATGHTEYLADPPQKKKFDPIFRVRNLQAVDLENNERPIDE